MSDSRIEIEWPDGSGQTYIAPDEDAAAIAADFIAQGARVWINDEPAGTGNPADPPDWTA